MKIILISNYSGSYGSENMLLRICSSLSGVGEVITVLNPAVKVDDSYLKRASAKVKKFNVISKANKRFSIGSLFFWLRLFLREKPDLVLINISLIPEPIFASRLLGVKNIVFVREGLEQFRALFYIYKIYLRLFSTRIVCNSQYTASMFDSNVSIISDCSDIDLVRSSEGLENKRYSELIDFLYVGRISRRKGIHNVFLAFLARTTINPIRFCIAGDSLPAEKDYFEQLRKRAACAPNVDAEFIGFSSKLSSLFFGVKWFLAPSVEPETFGLTVLESLSYGVPVIASGVGAYRELIEHGYNGFIYDVNDVHGLTHLIDYVINMEESEYFCFCKNAIRSSEKYSFRSYKKKIRALINVV